MTPSRRPLALWHRVVGDRPIVTRLVLAVAATMTVVLLLAGAFVFWRVEFALNRQLDQDLEAYQRVVESAVAEGTTPPSDTPGQTFAVYEPTGDLVETNIRDGHVLLDRATIRAAARGQRSRHDVGHLYPPAKDPYRVVTSRVETAGGPLVVASAISKHKHDEALRELLAQLAIADLATLAAASAVGYGTARAALNPVERYRRAAEEAVAAPVLPVDPSRDDEVTRLGHTFNALLDRVGQANERERQFLADASHELRSPLALMRTEIEVALLRPRSVMENQDAFTSLQGQVERLIDLSNALLDLEELRSSDHLDLAEVQLGDLMEETADRFRAPAAADGRRLVTSAPTGLTVRWQPRWLDLALGNLLSNALRHGLGRITVEAVLTDGGREVELSVCDEGPGFPGGFVDRAFDRFARAEASRSTPGTGLGLALVQAVATAHRGTVAITGPSTVTLRLPVDPERAA